MDYIGAFKAEPKDLKQSGVKGMKWGVRRSSRELQNAAKARGDTPAKKAESSAPATKPAGNIQDRVESSTDRYARLAGQAKAGQASAMSEQDLKFFNARTEALSKVNKMYEKNPSWLKDTTTKVIQQSAQRQMQGLADAIADKYVGDPIKTALKGAVDTAAVAKAAAKTPAATKTPEVAKTATKTAETTTASAKTSVADRLATRIAESKRSKQPAELPVEVKSSDPRRMRISDALKYYTDNPSEAPQVPVGYSPNAAKLFLDEVKRLRGS